MKNIRLYALVDYVKPRKHCTIENLQRHFNVSSATIHRDIAELVHRGVFQPLRGGVAFIDNSQLEEEHGVRANSFRERQDTNRAAKTILAKKAVKEIEEGDILFLDSSTTVTALIAEIAHTHFTNLTIITNSVAALQYYPSLPTNYVLLSLGGEYDPKLNAFLGAAALRELDRLTITKTFISCFGIDDKIATTNHERQAGLIARVLEKAAKRYLLADHSKVGRTGLYRLAARGTFTKIFSN